MSWASKRWNGSRQSPWTGFRAWAKQTLATGSSTQARLSFAKTVQFIDMPDASITTYPGSIITLTDTASKTLIALLGDAGVAETLGNEVVNAWTNSPTSPYETFTSSGAAITSAINTSVNGACFKAFSFTPGALMKIVQTSVKNSGTSPGYFWGSNTGFGAPNLSFTWPFGTSTIYKTLLAAYTHTGFLNAATTVNFAVSAFTLKQVLTPSTTGVVVRVLAEQTGFNRNDSTYTFTIAI